jgi:hypothetical protein
MKVALQAFWEVRWKATTLLLGRTYTGRIPGSMLQSSRGERTLREGAGPLP